MTKMGMRPASEYDGETIKLDAEREDPKPTHGACRIMHAAFVHHVGEGAWQSSLNKARTFFATKGVLGWFPDDGNILLDIVPCPAPHLGEWGYRLTFASVIGGQVNAIKVIFPFSELKL